MENLWEVKSISDAVVNLSDTIADRILGDAPKRPKKLSRVNKTVYVEGDLRHVVSDIINGMDVLNIHYILYIFDNPTEQKLFYRNVTEDESKYVNSWSDYKTKSMQIVSCYINGRIDTEFAENVLHEVTHLYQYGQGLEKNEDLYTRVIKMAQSDNKIERAVGFATYYTFRHEQDAMTHQFYGYLLQNNIDSKSFDELIQYSEYGRAIEALNIIKLNKKEASKYIYQLGITIKDWNYRIHYQYKRFRQKLYNAFYRYTVIDQHQTVEENKGCDINLRHIIQTQLSIDEVMRKYPNIEWGIEKIYDFS